jgi:hypothetical protein
LLPLALGVACVLLAACGPPEAEDDFYTLEDTRECLSEAGFRITTDPDELGFITATATGGGLRAYVQGGGGNSLTIAFGNTPEEAQQMVTAFENAARTRQQRRRLRTLMEGQGNSVLVWISEPTEAQRELVRGCLE